jgi:hypothetical protein
MFLHEENVNSASSAEVDVSSLEVGHTGVISSCTMRVTARLPQSLS